MSWDDMSDTERLEAELKMAKAEEKFAEAKAARQAGDLDKEAYRKAGAKVRAARREFRELQRRL